MPVMETPVDDYTYRELIKEAAVSLSPYLVGFVAFTNGRDSADASIGGSGTLATIDDLKGVITASHVVESLKKNDEVGLVLTGNAGSLQRLTFKPAYCSDVCLSTEQYSDSGPDLAFLVLPPDTTAALEAKMSYYNLTKHAERMLREPIPIDHGFWGLMGFAEEWSGDTAPPKGFSRAKLFKGGLGVGVVSAEYELGGFDYLTYEALYNEFYEGPESFGGFSGSGLWHLIVKFEDDKPHLTERLLSGMAFYQSEKLDRADSTTRDIACHGRKSLYDNLLKRVREERH